mmetsp:Transcript_18888/g.38144  ORF Transcript_18888/g.38144 Transcript_18888/m.38144 type:complete len:186 (-) Transcript_18888:423-980(-)
MRSPSYNRERERQEERGSVDLPRAHLISPIGTFLSFPFLFFLCSSLRLYLPTPSFYPLLLFFCISNFGFESGRHFSSLLGQSLGRWNIELSWTPPPLEKCIDFVMFGWLSFCDQSIDRSIRQLSLSFPRRPTDPLSDREDLTRPEQTDIRPAKRREDGLLFLFSHGYWGGKTESRNEEERWTKTE